MKYYYTCIIYWIINVLALSQSQYAQRIPQGNLCDGNKAALVEHFFTVIFTEFRNPQPVCVCVQMCIDQATYCYPNGCMKRVEVKKKVPEEKKQQEDLQVTQLQNKPVFIIDTTGNQVAKGIEENYNDSSKFISIDSYFKKPINIYSIGEKFENLFKFRKTPKVHLQYNLREQVKNTKSNVISTDIANNRWPFKWKQVSIGKTYQPNFDAINAPLVENAKHFKTSPSLTPRYFKRDLKTSESSADGKPSFSETEEQEKVSLDKLINDLIESSLDNSDRVDKKNSIQELEADIKNEDVYLVTSTDLDFAPSNDKTIPYDITTSALTLVNDTTEYLYNKSFEYDEDQTSSQTHKEMFKNVYNDDMIETLSKSIEKLNNTSFEVLKTNSANIEEITQSLADNDIETHKKIISNDTIRYVNENSRKDNDTNEIITKTPASN